MLCVALIEVGEERWRSASLSTDEQFEKQRIISEIELLRVFN